jgi:hypothetical protein
MTHHIRERFPSQEDLIDLLMAKDPEFLDLCEDHDACVNALRYWTKSNEPESENRVIEYHTVIKELEEEISQYLSVAKPQRLD